MKVFLFFLASNSDDGGGGGDNDIGGAFTTTAGLCVFVGVVVGVCWSYLSASLPSKREYFVATVKS